MKNARLIAAGVTTGALLISAAPGMAASVSPTIIGGNPTCDDLAAATGNTGWKELKVDPPASGTYTSADGALTVTVTVSADSKSFDFTVADNELVDVAFAKGGSQGGNLYDYTPDGTNSDSGLTTPITGGSGGAAALSHITFCYVPDKTPPSKSTPGPDTPESTPATPASDTPAITPQPQGEVLGETKSSTPKKHKKSKKAKKARKKVKAVKVKAVRTPRFTG
jgi:hypothetical protein